MNKLDDVFSNRGPRKQLFNEFKRLDVLIVASIVVRCS